MAGDQSCTQAVAHFLLHKRDEAGELVETIEGSDDWDYLIRTLPDGTSERIFLPEWLSQAPAQLS